ncbi:MAG: class I SAM-dependent methyltransferase [Burkholderiales bacterium]|nr:class I SAM-dependent methyltransferase [Burkholderiales bacterium]
MFLKTILITAGFALLLPLQARAQLAQPPHWQFDVPFVPTPYVVIEEMLRLANVTPQDFVMDLGSGDGRVLITAAKKFGARGIGVDLDGELVAESIEAAAAAGVGERVKFLQQDLFKTDISQATVITMYLLPGVMMRLRPLLLNLKPGTRLVSHDFRLDDWNPDATTQIRKNAFLWIVPAKVAGKWDMKFTLPGADSSASAHSITLELRQKFQEVDGFARFDGRHAQVWGSRLSGDRLSFVIVDDRDRDHEASLYFEGRVSGDVIEGSFRRGTGNTQTVHGWRAVRAAP